MLSKKGLAQKRAEIEQLRINSSLSLQQAEQLGQSISSSWERSQLASISSELEAAPLNEKIQISNQLNNALEQSKSELSHIARQSSMVIAVADIGSTIVWSAASGKMQKEAEKVHFVQGGRWGEEIVGTNALALSLKTQQSSCVFSCEHFMSSVQDWVCYATPIVHPVTQELIGVVDLSTTWNKHNSLGLLAVERCAAIIQSSLAKNLENKLYLRCFGQAKVLLNGQLMVLTPRQVEILTILALCPNGLSLDALHQALYGERNVSLGTLKAEMSHLRELVGNVLSSRPYRISCLIDADFLQFEQALDAGYFQSCLDMIRGIFLYKTESPFLCTWRACFESRLSQVIFKMNETDVLYKHLSRCPEAYDAIDRLIELIPQNHPSHQILIQFQNEHTV